jgi:hypothetical protein
MSFHFAQDYWLTRDKLEHLFGSALLFSFLYILGLRFLFCPMRSVAALLAVIGGILWEIKDGFRDGFSYKDLVADCIGIMAMWFIAI